MAIEPPPLVEALPGDPITSEGWNNIITALRTLFTAANETGTLLSVRVLDDGSSTISDAWVTLEPTSEGAPRVGLYAGGDVRRYLVPGIADGKYTLYVEADGYDAEKRELEIAGTSREIEVEMTPIRVEAPVPDLFGLNLTQAVAKLKSTGFRVNRVLDVYGNELTSRQIEETGANRFVLNQSPEANARHEQGGNVNLAASAAPIVEERITVPDVRGMSLEEAKQALETVGLLVGSVETQTKPTNGE